MKHTVTLTVTSLLSMLLLVFHLTENLVRGFEPGRLPTIGGALLLAVWLFGTLVLAEQRAGYVIMLLGALLGSVVPVAYLRGAGLAGGRIANSSGAFTWVWTLLALGVTATFSAILSARGLWSLRRDQSR